VNLWPFRVYEGQCILCFITKAKSEQFIEAYKKIFHCTRPLTSISIGIIEELWALLNNKAKDPDYKTPYGLIIDFNYDGQKYNKYDIEGLKMIGIQGLAKGMKAVI
jgi:hypothetical protein